MGIINSLTEGNRTSMDSRTNVELQGEAFKTFKFKTENLSPRVQAVIVEQKNIGGETGIYGNALFGVYGVSKYGTTASQSFILGQSVLGVNALGDRASSYGAIRVIPPNDLFEESIVTSYFINTTSTTATISIPGSVIF